VGVERLYSDEAVRALGKRFYTDDDKIHLDGMALIGRFDLGRFEWGEVNESYPLMAFDFRINELWNTGYTYWDNEESSQRNPDALLLIHPEDAAERGITNKAWVFLRSTRGECKAVARITEDVVRGSVGMPALFPKEGQEFNYVTRADVSPINGEMDTMVAVDVVLA